MQFYVSEQKVAKDRRWAIGLIVVLLVCCVALLVKAVGVSAGSELMLPFAGLAILALTIFATFRHIQQGVAAYPSVRLDEARHQALVSYNGVSVQVDLLQVKSLRFQTRFGRVKSIVLKAGTGELFKLAGFEDMDGLIAALERLVPADRMSRTAFLHQ